MKIKTLGCRNFNVQQVSGFRCQARKKECKTSAFAKANQAVDYSQPLGRVKKSAKIFFSRF
ncbi:MAG: hypothetical protein R6U27_15735, partial [Desulfobacterales bacterium]